MGISVFNFIFHQSDEASNFNLHRSNDEVKDHKYISNCSMVDGSKFIYTNDDNVFPHPPEFQPVSDMISGKIDQTSSTPPVCHYHCPMHHPHFAQEILRCYSSWRSQPDGQPVLLVPRPQFSRFLTNPAEFQRRFPISSGILETLKTKMRLVVTKVYPNATSFKTKDFLEKDNTISPFAIGSRKDAMKFRSMFVPSAESYKNRTLKSSLRIGIVNRAGARSLLNPLDIRNAVMESYPTHQVVLRYFEDNTIEELIEFYSNVDIVISPHGSQLTGIMFMAPCSAVLELFPHNYYTPNYFSSLARIFGLVHLNWYVSSSTIPHELDLKTRLANTGNNICPSLNRVVSGVQQMIDYRKQCLSNSI